MIRALLLILCLLISQVLWGQVDSTAVKSENPGPRQEITSFKVYKTHPEWEIPVSIALISAASLGYKQMDKIASLTKEDALALNPESINSFDRPAAYYDPAGFASAQNNSDIWMTVFVVSPVFLVFDKKIRRDWADMLGMLLAAHAVDNSIFFSTLLVVRRPRPLTYNPMVDIDAKTGEGKTNSFYSGHVSWAATSTFFLVKVYTDYHHIKGMKRILLYTGAALPPALIGYWRMHAGRHFASDALVGLLTGAVSGIVVPELHRIKDKTGLSFNPFSRFGASGLTVSYHIK